MRDLEGLLGVFFWLFILLAAVAFNLFVGGSCLQYCLDFWSFHMTHVVAHASFWPCAFVSVFFGELFIGFAIFTWILSFFI
ncbi:MAG: hypothetical protein HY226_04020 [Candidatus Vogelbacteria bacterium]|nr:hypothetical protein [Candidatus Vogelbacteria bacterium]